MNPVTRQTCGRGPGAEDGSMLPLVGALLFTAIVVVALLADLAMLQVAYRSAASQADRIAEAAAAMIDEADVHARGTVVLDQEAARARAIDVAEGEGLGHSDVGVEVAPDRVCVTVTRVHEPSSLRVIGGGPAEVRVRSCAAPGSG